jgi:lysophospholipase L1-like esterase
MEIGIWGDSITYGECDSEGLGWVGRLRKSYAVDDYIGVYNRGICGDTTSDLLKHFSIEADSIQPNKIAFAIGINDSKYAAGETNNKVPLEEFKSNMRLLIEQAKAHTKEIYIVSATKVDDTARPSGTRFVNQDIKLYNEFLAELSQEESLVFIDVFDLLDATDLYDGLHPNAGGYEKLFSAIAIKLK